MLSSQAAPPPARMKRACVGMGSAWMGTSPRSTADSSALFARSAALQ